MPRYRSFLTALYGKLGGRVSIGTFLREDDLRRETAETIVNCGGAWGSCLWEDPLSSRFVKGILVLARAGGVIPWNRITGEVFSYQYHPLPAIYARPDGSSADLYFYPRADGWLLGGTRLESDDLLPGDVCLSDDSERWRGERWAGETIPIPQEGLPSETCDVPAPMVTLNREILRALTGTDVRAMPLSALVGYRHKRPVVRLESSTDDSRRVIHNYGHGGAGVTLSWSCAIRVAAAIQAGDSVCEDRVVPLLVEAARDLS